jgi:uncharacterized protein
MTKVMIHEPDASRYTLLIGDELIAVADYRLNGNAISFTHTYTQPSHRGRGLASELIEFAMDDVEANSTRRVLPMCWYVADWFEANPERRGLLER